MEIRRAADLGPRAREKIGEIFAEAFYGDLRLFSRDREKLARACAHMFSLGHFHAALIGGEIAGVAACLGADSYCVRFDRKALARHLGPARGLLAAFGFSCLGRSPKYPPEVKMDGKTASVEFVATAAAHRGKGVASAILAHLHSLPEYSAYVLEVRDTNAAALALYEKLGYREIHRKKFRWARLADFGHFVYMKRLREPTA